MGKLSRTKGRSFEQDIATLYRERWSEATVRRSLQAHQPYEPDVVIEHPDQVVVSAIWSECQHAAKPTPLLKLAQAERDIKIAVSKGRSPGMMPTASGPVPHPWLPFAIWRRSGARGKGSVQVTTRLWAWQALLSGHSGSGHLDPRIEQIVITLDFADWLSSIRNG